MPQNLKQSPSWFDVYSLNIKSSGRLFQILVAFSEFLNSNFQKCVTEKIEIPSLPTVFPLINNKLPALLDYQKMLPSWIFFNLHVFLLWFITIIFNVAGQTGFIFFSLHNAQIAFEYGYDVLSFVWFTITILNDTCQTGFITCS